MKAFNKIDPSELNDNTFRLIGDDWMLVTAGDKNSFNTMTASWGGVGVMWHKKICFCVIRPTRHTFGFMEKNPYFTLSFFDESHRSKLKYCGSHSGREFDKIKNTCLTPINGINNTVYFEEARIVLGCKKIYTDDIKPENFLDTGINKNYPKKDYHRLYMGEIVDCLIAD